MPYPRTVMLTKVSIHLHDSATIGM
jgi:hypothetical protein